MTVTTGHPEKRTIVEAIIALSVNLPTDPGDLDTWLKSAGYWLEEFQLVGKDLRAVLAAHAFLTTALLAQAWVCEHLVSRAITEQIGKERA